MENNPAPIYKGYSTVKSAPTTMTESYDRDLIKADLLNHLNIAYREVVGRPGFGCGLHALLAEPFDDVTENAVVAEVYKTVTYDPRLQLVSMDVTTDRANHGIRVQVRVRYSELGDDELLEFFVDGKALKQ